MGLVLPGFGSLAFALFTTIGGHAAGEGGMLRASQNVTQPPVSAAMPGCEPDASVPAAASSQGALQSQEIFNLLSALRPDDGLSIRTFDGRRCTGRFVSVQTGALTARLGKQNVSVPLTDIRLVYHDESLWALVKETAVEGAIEVGKLTGILCAVGGPPMMALCGGIGGAVGGSIGAGVGALRNVFERPERVYERASVP